MKMTEELAELLGIMCGDGCLSRYGRQRIIYICGHKQDDLLYHQSITTRLFKETFEKEIQIKLRKKENALFIRFSDKSLFYIFKSLGLPVGKKYASLAIPKGVVSHNHFQAFVRGLFDTDGCLILSKQHRKVHYYPRIEITSKSKGFLMEILKRLKALGFYGSVSHKGNDNYRLEIPGFKNLELWLKSVGSSHPLKREKLKKGRKSASGETFRQYPRNSDIVF